jgi:hypothetical protein
MNEEVFIPSKEWISSSPVIMGVGCQLRSMTRITRHAAIALKRYEADPPVNC